MVATRNHPKDFEPPPSESPTKRSTRTSTEPSATATATESPSKRFTRTFTKPQATESPTKRTPRTPISTTITSHTAPTLAASPPQPMSRTRTSASSVTAYTRSGWSHTPSNMTLIWLAISLPLVIWDTGYVVLRPYSMPGGSLHSPIWKPYGLYGTIDHVYGFKSYNAHNGWTLAQGSVNAVETAAYFVYLYLVYAYGQQETTQGRGAPDKGFDNIGHNDPLTLFFMWIIPNGAWLVFPAYMMYVFGQEILQGLELATNGGRKYR
ncbi:hypothetical protein LTR85_004165 [Meristemomyces frigidus]|nr:hypothetical protein LTR85_004165 [Meristemomyces frigidus]